LGLFFQVTAIFLLVFVVQLLIYSFHEMTEANIFPYSEPLHWATEPFGPDGIYGQWLSALLVILPLGWLVVSSFRSRPATAPASAVTKTTELESDPENPEPRTCNLEPGTSNREHRTKNAERRTAALVFSC